jgi:hypothetical protein
LPVRGSHLGGRGIGEITRRRGRLSAQPHDHEHRCSDDAEKTADWNDLTLVLHEASQSSMKDDLSMRP